MFENTKTHLPSTLIRVALPALFLALGPVTACSVQVDGSAPTSDGTQTEAEPLRATGRSAEINYYHKSCSIASVVPILIPVSPRGHDYNAPAQLTVRYNLQCEDGSKPVESISTTVSRTYTSASYNLSNYEFIYNGNVHVADTYMPQLNKKYSPVLWDADTAADASLRDLSRYDASRVSVKDYALTPAYPLDGANGNYSDRSPDEFPHVAARFVWGQDSHYVADLHIFPSNRAAASKNILANPLVVSDAFDPLNERDAFTIYSTPQYKKLLSLNPADAGPRTGPDGQGYDVVFVDFSQGGGDLLINAHLYLRALQWVQDHSPGSVVVGGISMGGVVARLALLWSMPGNNVAGADYATKVSGFVSVDAPQLGASISPRMQQIACQISEHKWLPDSSDSNAAVNNWQQIRTPAAHEMLFGHYYRSDSSNTRCGNSNSNSKIHDKFYALLNTLGANAYPTNKRGFRADLPLLGVAYSNFYKPHGTLDPSVKTTAGNVDPPIVDARDFFVGGPVGDPQRLEAYPGSTGFWYWKPYRRSSPEYVYPGTLDGEVFKGTFIPINSALALRPDYDVLHPTHSGELDLATKSAFDRVYYMQNATNNYSAEFGSSPAHTADVNDKRFQHMVFDAALMGTLQRALHDLRSGVVAPLDCSGASGGWQGCRGSGCAACSELTAAYPLYFTNNPKCQKNTTCNNQFFTCSSNCPQPTSADTCNGTSGEWQGCRGNGCAVCAELVAGYPRYFANHPACAQNGTCAGSYGTCNSNCPAPTEGDR